MTDTAFINDSDNLEDVQDTQEPVDTDNSEEEQIDKPDNEDNGADNNNDEGEQELILGKFKTQEDLINAYTALEKHQGTKAQELAELKQKADLADKLQKQQQEIAEMYGFESVEALNNHQQKQKVDKDLANFVADEYAKHLGSVEYAEDVRKLLLAYKANPDDKELLTSIKNEFPLEVIENVAVEISKYKGQLEQVKFQALEQQEIERAGNYLKETIAKYDDDRYFRNNDFKGIYTELFKAFGTDLNTDYTINMIEKYVQSRIAQHEKSKSMKKENDDLTNSFGNLSQSDNQAQGSTKGVLDMTPEELSKALRTTYKNI